MIYCGRSKVGIFQPVPERCDWTTEKSVLHFSVFIMWAHFSLTPCECLLLVLLFHSLLSDWSQISDSHSLLTFTFSLLLFFFKSDVTHFRRFKYHSGTLQKQQFILTIRTLSFHFTIIRGKMVLHEVIILGCFSICHFAWPQKIPHFDGTRRYVSSNMLENGHW